jgi:hypothetical protein
MFLNKSQKTSSGIYTISPHFDLFIYMTISECPATNLNIIICSAVKKDIYDRDSCISVKELERRNTNSKLSYPQKLLDIARRQTCF